MEDPTKFDLWGSVNPSRRTEARETLLKTRSELTRREVFQEVVRAIFDDRPLLIAADLEWTNVQALKASLAPDFRDADIYQSGCKPADQLFHRQCSKHLVYHIGSLGCPVCDGSHCARTP